MKKYAIKFLMGILIGFICSCLYACCSNCSVKSNFADVQNVNNSNSSFNTENYVWEDWTVSTNKTTLEKR